MLKMELDKDIQGVEEGLYEKIIEKATFSKNRIRIMIYMVFIFVAGGMEMAIFNFIINS